MPDRPAEPAVAAPDPVVAVDVGGSLIKGAILGGGCSGATRWWPTPRTDRPAAVVAAVLAAIDELVGECDTVAAVGLAVPGIVDSERGVAVAAANVGWHRVPFRDLVERRTGRPVSVGHDVRACAEAEIRLGAARGAYDAVVLPIGTGIAAAMLVQGRLLHTGCGRAGEIGHLHVGHDEPCACGGRGCLEAIASAAAICRRFTARTGRRVAGAVDIAELVRGGDGDAAAVWDEAVDSLAVAVAAYVTLLAPEVVVLGGGLCAAQDLLLPSLDERLVGRLAFQRRPRLVAAAFGDRAGCVGAALQAWDLLGRGPGPR
ncbi:MAG TPA: ROK family protein [Micromonosporaceae bacterium]|nr:ROK family protein [Micromonosporaceae bacterium]